MEFVESRSSIWQGAGIGLTVSALNHVAHEMNERRNIMSILKNKNLSPTHKATLNLDTVYQRWSKCSFQ